jgi:hypothetical protein
MRCRRMLPLAMFGVVIVVFVVATDIRAARR